MEALSADAFAAYRGLVWEDERFEGFFRQFTPIEELALFEIGSRPARRPEGGELLSSLRAIPWVFAWTQNRCILPAWYGCGTAFAGADLGELRRLYRGWAFFRSLVENLEMTLAKSSLEIAAGYLDLVEDASLYETIRAEHERTVAAVIEIVEAQELLDRHPVVQRSIRLRNPYVDPMNAIQVELLRRWRETGDEEVKTPAPPLDRGDRRGPAQHRLATSGREPRPTSSRLARLWPLAELRRRGGGRRACRARAARRPGLP